MNYAGSVSTQTLMAIQEWLSANRSRSAEITIQQDRIHDNLEHRIWLWDGDELIGNSFTSKELENATPKDIQDALRRDREDKEYQQYLTLKERFESQDKRKEDSQDETEV